ncbi:MAG: putative ABC transporter permease [Bacilli bacterium]|nr:putative ABC transporter permease [Bacilli bacterium]MDD4282728.1 putative ABC transporter permease [Bacilli bacterium]
MYTYIWLFFIYSFLGWCAEVAYCALNKGKFINSGFLNGPVCPIYGFGAVTILLLLEPVMDNTLLLFLGSILLASTIELIAGFVLEKLFNKKWWDYTTYPFNFKGYICFKFSIMWGLASLFVLKIIHPFIIDLINFIPLNLGYILLFPFILIIIIDIVATIRLINKLNKKLELVDDVANRIRDISDDLAEKIFERSLLLTEKNDDAIKIIEDKITEFDNGVKMRKQELSKLKEKYDEYLNNKFFGENRMLRAFPKMNSKKHKEVLEELKNEKNKRSK